MKLYFIPFAGGSEISYNQLIHTISKRSDLTCIQCTLPGRGRRIGEALVSDVSLMAQDLKRQITSTLQGESYAIFGHSMGALLATHVLSLFRNESIPQPSHLFLSGRTGEIKKPDPPFKSEMSSSEFREALRDLGGIAKEVLDDDDIMSFFEPIIKNDFAAIENYLPIDCQLGDLSVTKFYGDQDDYPEEEAHEWQRITTKPINVKVFSGGHFFIFSESEKISGEIISALNI